MASEAGDGEKAPSKAPSRSSKKAESKPGSRASQKPPSKQPSEFGEKPQSKAPSVASQKPPSKEATNVSQKPPSKEPTNVSQKPPSKEPTSVSQKPPSKEPTNISQKPPSTEPTALAEKPPSKAPSIISNASKRSRKSKGSRKSVQLSEPPEFERSGSLQTVNHPFPRRNNTHIGHRSPSTTSLPLPDGMKRSQSLPAKPAPESVSLPRREMSEMSLPTPPPSVGGTPRSDYTPKGTPRDLTPRRLEPLATGSQISIGTLNSLAKVPSLFSEGSLHIPDPLEEPGKLASTARFMDGDESEFSAGLPPDPLPRERYFGSAASRKSKKSVHVMPEIVEMKEPKHPRNIYIQKKIRELESINKSLKKGPWDREIGLDPRKPDIQIMGPYTLDEVKYERDDPPVRITITPEHPDDIIDIIGKRFQLPPAWDPETGQIKEEIARAAAVMAQVVADPRESRQNPDPIGPSLCDCCEDMNDHNRHLADLERKDPRPRVVQTKQLEQLYGKFGKVSPTGYYRSDSPTLIPVSTYMERDLASEEMVKAGVAETLVTKLKNVAKPKDLDMHQVPWPFYANEITSTNDLNAYLETGLPMSTDALLSVNIGQANSRYKDSMDRLDKMLRKF